jgi:hypothetical protein
MVLRKKGKETKQQRKTKKRGKTTERRGPPIALLGTYQ